jgi:NAD(P)-dependent dehydrogenase (short-subunit alcohol dehydrogenase family)
MVDLGLEGKVAIVTGSGAGLGRTYALALGEEGVAVAVADVDGESAARVAQEIQAKGGKAMPLEVDVTDESAVARGVSETVERLGGVDILVNNAGWRAIPTGHHYDNIPDDFQEAEHWDRIMRVNVLGPLICARACRKAMAARGGGVVVNQTSMAAYWKPSGAYGVSKVACSGLTVSLATELAPDNIRVNGIAPGVMTQRLGDPERVQAILDAQLIKRKGRPEDLVGALLFLTSDMSSFVTGVNLLVDGGVVRQV